MPFLVFFIGFPAALMVLFATYIGGEALRTMRSLERGAPSVAIRCTASSPPVCTEYSVADHATARIGIAALLCIAGVALWPIGFRERHVTLDAKTVRITWGERFAMPLHQYDAKEIGDMNIANEKRFSVTPIVGTSVNRMKRMPDRWRLRGTYRGRMINLGSYATKLDAQKAKEHIRAAQPNAEDGIYHYGRS